jgi:7-carboxy-7-deazaguanine synthase (Cx14CxxC type)
MTYTIKEIFYTLQGEGTHTGRPAVFCRFSGCNLWTGREQDRSSAICNFCDTDFIGVGPDGGKFRSPDDLADAVARHWPSLNGHGKRFVVCTGGEPLLQLDEAAIAALHERGFEVAIETNGTLEPPAGVDWICVSPKGGSTTVLRHGSELKLVYPQPDAQPERFEADDFSEFYLQPMDGPDLARNTQLALEYCLVHPQWKLSLQTHKFVGIR